MKFSKTDVKRYLYQIGWSLVGTFLVALGIQMIVVSNLGADALSTFILGMMNYVDIRFGTISLLINCAILVVVFFKQRQMIGLASIINSFGIGIFLNLLAHTGVVTASSFLMRVLFIFIGVELFALGTALYLVTESGSGAYECLMFLISQWTKQSVQIARMLTDGFFMIIGILLGGPFHIGTIVVVLLLGPSLQFYLRRLQKLRHHRSYQNPL